MVQVGEAVPRELAAQKLLLALRAVNALGDAEQTLRGERKKLHAKPLRCCALHEQAHAAGGRLPAHCEPERGAQPSNIARQAQLRGERREVVAASFMVGQRGPGAFCHIFNKNAPARLNVKFTYACMHRPQGILNAASLTPHAIHPSVSVLLLNILANFSLKVNSGEFARI